MNLTDLPIVPHDLLTKYDIASRDMMTAILASRPAEELVKLQAVMIEARNNIAYNLRLADDYINL